MQLRRIRRCLLFAALMASFCGAQVAAQQRSALFTGLEMELTRAADVMTDATTCALRIGPPSWQIVVTGPDQFFVQPSSRWSLAPDETHLIRIGTDPAIPLTYVPKRNAATITDPQKAANVVRALVRGIDVKVRLFSWPDRKVLDYSVDNPNVGLGYRRAMQTCGWREIGAVAELAPPKLSVYESADPTFRGSASATVIGNKTLGLRRSSDALGGACYLEVGVSRLFGLEDGRWFSQVMDNRSIQVRDETGIVVLARTASPSIDSRVGARRFDAALDTARAAWQAAPLGSISLDPADTYQTTTLLYGFRELWAWGVQRCGFPAIQE